MTVMLAMISLVGFSIDTSAQNRRVNRTERNQKRDVKNTKQIRQRNAERARQNRNAQVRQNRTVQNTRSRTRTNQVRRNRTKIKSNEIVSEPTGLDKIKLNKSDEIAFATIQVRRNPVNNQLRRNNQPTVSCLSQRQLLQHDFARRGLTQKRGQKRLSTRRSRRTCRQ